MNNIIKEQLKKCTVAEIPEFKDDEEVIYIKRHTVGEFAIMKNHSYLIEVEDGMVCQHNPLDNMDFGMNTLLTSKYYSICINEITNKFIKVDALGIINTDTCETNGEMRMGIWLECNKIKILKELIQ